MRKYSREERNELLKQYSQFDGGVTEFCNAKGVNVKTFWGWRCNERKRNCVKQNDEAYTSVDASQQFAPIQLCDLNEFPLPTQSPQTQSPQAQSPQAQSSITTPAPIPCTVHLPNGMRIDTQTENLAQLILEISKQTLPTPNTPPCSH